MRGNLRRYDRQGVLALEPSAFFSFFFDAPDRGNETRGAVAVVSIRGPLDAHRGGWCDSYEAIVERVNEACDGPSSAIVLRIDSPGGDVAGMLDACETIRARCAEAGKRLLAFVDGKACSAAYALACVAEQVVVDPAALLGSIGVISARVDVSALDEAMGVKVAVLASGARKADGHPSKPITDAELAETQTIIDGLAEPFFEHVSKHRGLDAAAIAALEARIFTGAAAVRAGLADAIGTFDSVLALAAGTAAGAAPTRSTTVDEARKALQAIIDDDNADEASKARAKKALAAMDEDEGDDKPEGKSKAEGEGDDKPEGKSKAEGDDKKDDEPKENAAASVKLAARIQALESEAAARAELDRVRAENEERSKLLATRPDFAPEALDVLRNAPLATVKDAVAKWPRGPVRLAHNPHAATAVVSSSATRGESQGGGGSQLPPDEARVLDERMGLRRAAQAVSHDGTTMALHVMTKAEARDYAARKQVQPKA